MRKSMISAVAVAVTAIALAGSLLLPTEEPNAEGEGDAGEPCS